MKENVSIRSPPHKGRSMSIRCDADFSRLKEIVYKKQTRRNRMNRKESRKRIVHIVLAAIMFFSAFLPPLTTAYGAETGSDLPKGKVTFYVGSNGSVLLTDSDGKETAIEADTVYELECEVGFTWQMEVTADVEYEITEYTVMYADGAMERREPNGTETKDNIRTELAMSDGMKVKVTFRKMEPETSVSESGTEKEGQSTEEQQKEDQPKAGMTESRVSSEPGKVTETEADSKEDAKEDGLYRYQSEGYVRTTIVPESSEEMLIYFGTGTSTGMARRAARAAGSVTLVRGASYRYPSYWGSRSGSHRFTLDGNIAFCANPQEAEPGDGTYPSAYGTVSTTTNSTVLRVLSYGYGGANDCTAAYLSSIGRDTADDTRYALTHVAVAVAFGDSNPFYRANDTCRSDVMGFINYINGLSFDSSGMSAQYVEVAGMQSIIRIVGDKKQNVDLTITKRSVTDLSAGRGEMRLTGAVFQLYGWNGSASGYTRYAGTSVDNGDGTYTFKNVNLSLGDGGHFLVRETTAPKGYERTYFNFNADDATDQFGWGGRQFVYANGTWTCQTLQNYEYPSWGFIFLDNPKTQQFTVTKVDANTNGKLTGAEFTLYGWNSTTNKYDINLGKFTDNRNGTYTSPTFYIDRGDNRKYLIKETKAPDGYLLSTADTADADLKAYGGRQVVLDADGNITGSPDFTFKNQPENGALKLKKVSANPELTEENTCYALEGAEFGVYSDEACQTLAGTLTTVKNGNSGELILKPGSYWVKETKAPMGYALEPDAKKVEVTAGNTATVTFSDQPQGNPVEILLGKVDKETNDNKPAGSASLENAEFTVKYYNGLYTPENLPEKATRSWVLKTDEAGCCILDEGYKLSGDEFYKSTSGVVILPLGTVTMQETKAPEGYLTNEEIFLRQITSEGSAEWVDTYNAPIIPENALKLNIRKMQSGTDKAIPGAVFEHTRPDGTTESLTTDENGELSFVGLEWGDHVVKEISAPDGYAVNTNETRFSVREGNIISIVSKAATTDTDGNIAVAISGEGSIEAVVEDKPAPYAVKLVKKNNKGAVLGGAEFTLYADEDCKMVIDVRATDDQGILTMENLIVGKTYYLKETKAPEGYRLPENVKPYKIYVESVPVEGVFDFYINEEKLTVEDTDTTKEVYLSGTEAERIINFNVVNYAGSKLPETGSYATVILVSVGAVLMALVLIVNRIKNKKMRKDQ